MKTGKRVLSLFVVQALFALIVTNLGYADSIISEQKTLSTTTLSPTMSIDAKVVKETFDERTRQEGNSVNNTIVLNDLNISLGSFAPFITEVNSSQINRLTLTNLVGQKINIDYMDYDAFGTASIKIGNGTYIIRDVNKLVDISKVNTLGNQEYLDFFGLKADDISLENISYGLPVDEPNRVKQADLFPANKNQQPDLVANKVSEAVLTKARLTVRDLMNASNVPITLEALNQITILGLNGNWEDYYLAQDLLSRFLESKEVFLSYKESKVPAKDIVIGLADYLYFVYVGCDWAKWAQHSNERRKEALKKEKIQDTTKPTTKVRAKTLFELPVEPTRLPVKDVENWEVVDAVALGDTDLDFIPEDSSFQEVILGQQSINNGRVVALPFSGGSATTVKNLIGAHKMVHKALKVITSKMGANLQEKWISIIQARLGLLLGQNKKTQIAVNTSVAGTIEGESDRSVRQVLFEQFPEEMASGQIKVPMQRAGLVLDNETGYPIRFKDGHVATCAENHLWAFLALLMDKDAMIDILKNTDGIISAGNGDNVLNYTRAGMIGRILKARQDGRALATVAASSPSAGDKKGGIAAKITYRNKITGQTITQQEFREISEFPSVLEELNAKGEMDLAFSAIDFRSEKENNSEIYQSIKEKGLFIEDLFSGKKVAFNNAFYAVDAKLFLARMFGFDENSAAVVENLEGVDEGLWAKKIMDFAKQVPMSKKPAKKVPNENGTHKAVGYITEQAVQDFIVNSLGLLAREGSPNPEFEALLIERKDAFLPYKGTNQDIIAEDGTVQENEKPKYDLVANQARYKGVIDELKAKGHYIQLGDGERVEEVIPVSSLEEIVLANKKDNDSASNNSLTDAEMSLKHQESIKQLQAIQNLLLQAI